MRQSNNYIDDTEIEVQRAAPAAGSWGLTHREYFGASTLDATLAYRRGTGAFGAMAAPEEGCGLHRQAGQGRHADRGQPGARRLARHCRLRRRGRGRPALRRRRVWRCHQQSADQSVPRPARRDSTGEGGEARPDCHPGGRHRRDRWSGRGNGHEQRHRRYRQQLLDPEEGRSGQGMLEWKDLHGPTAERRVCP
ncbi:ShlB/FhaC/HecB family hemolysin secretion/activation protein [Cupriavidus basilensis]|uniref:ShlB/FhaC/HecB family hemolysin secretion/activation protein n=1 Tax=Cupriavidus basilensis TaxID=68895 RepID=UPI003C2B2486